MTPVDESSHDDAKRTSASCGGTGRPMRSGTQLRGRVRGEFRMLCRNIVREQDCRGCEQKGGANPGMFRD